MSERQKAKQSLENLGRALDRLEEAIDESKELNSLAIDGTIQRFEFVIELFWKTMKRLLAIEGVLSTTPKDTLKKAYSVKWIQNEAVWLEMLKDRNETSHVYDEKTAQRIYSHICHNIKELRRTYEFLINQVFSK